MLRLSNLFHTILEATELKCCEITVKLFFKIKLNV